MYRILTIIVNGVLCCAFTVVQVFAQEFLFEREIDTIPVSNNGVSVHSPFGGGFTQSYPTFADIDSDGDFDLFVGEYDGNINFFRNTGTVSEPAFTFVTENFTSDFNKQYSKPTFVDIDNDGDLDLFVGKYAGSINLYRNKGTPANPAFALESENFAGIQVGRTSSPAFIDIDNDSDFDLFVGEEDGNINFYRNDGTALNPTFVLVTENFASIDIGFYSIPTFADLDKDGDWDLFVGAGGGINYYRNIGTVSAPNFSLGSPLRHLDVGNDSSPTFADLDNDGSQELIVGNEDGNLNYYKNVGTVAAPAFTLVTENLCTIDNGGISFPTFADLDSDGDLDLIAGRDLRLFTFGKSHNLNFFRNVGTGANPSFILDSENLVSDRIAGNPAPAFADIDGDGDLDLFVGSRDGNVIFYRNTGTAKNPIFSLETKYLASIDVGSNSTPILVDIDNDGDLDLFMGEYDGNINFYRNTGTVSSPSFILATENFAAIDIGSFSVPTFVDIDRDDDWDLFVGVGQFGGYIGFYRNIGTASDPLFETENFAPIDIGNFANPTFADIDKDNDFDLFIGDDDGGLYFYRNKSGRVVQVGLPNATCLQGPSVVIPVTINPADGVLSADVVVTYTSSILKATGVRTTSATNGFSLNSDLNTSGEVRFSLTGSIPLSGNEAVLVEILFDVLGSSGNISPLTIKSASLNGGKLQTVIRNGSFAVNFACGTDTKKLYLRSNLTLNETGEPGTSTLQYFGASGSEKWTYVLKSDLKGNLYRFRIMLGFVTVTRYDFEIILGKKGGGRTILATGQSIPSPSTPSIFSKDVFGPDPTTALGDTIILKISWSGTGARIRLSESDLFSYSASYIEIPSSPEDFPPAPAAPSLASPSDGSTDISTSPTLSWNLSNGATSYRLQISTSSTFSTAVVDQIRITGASYNVSGLYNNTVYYWRVNATNTGGTSDWSNVWSFNTAIVIPPAPVPLAPPFGEKGVSISPSLSWNSSSGASAYRLQISTNSAFSTTVVDQNGIIGTSYSLSSLSFNTTYYWRVNATNAKGTSDWSSVWNFTTIAAPLAPSLISPFDGAGNQPANVVLSWNTSQYAATYHLQVSTSSTFNTTVVDDSTLTGTSRQVGPLGNNTTYYWRVRAKNLAGTSPWSSVRRFTTVIAPPSAPLLVSPSNGAVNQPTPLTLRWSALMGLVTYRLQVSTTLDFTSTIFDDSTITSSFRQIGLFEYNKSYYWRVKAKNAGGASAWSSVWGFSTLPLPRQVLLFSPLHSAIIGADSVRFTWQRSTPVVIRYWFEISTDSLMTKSIVDSTLIDTTTVRRKLVNNQTYWWRVRARNIVGWGIFSAQRRFRIDIPTSVEAEAEAKIPREFSLSQNYPNPFNPSTTIEYALPKPGYVELKVYDLHGHELQELVNVKQEAGKYLIVFNAANLQSGVYFYRLRVSKPSAGAGQDFVQTKKLILLK